MKNILYIVIFLLTSFGYGQNKYASVSGSGSHDGSSTSNEWTLSEALSNARPGDDVYIKPGLYTGIYNQSWNGTSLNPIRFIGYTTTAGDVDEDAESTYNRGNRTITVPSFWTYNSNNDNAFTSSVLPTFERTASPTAGVLLTISGDYVHMYNLQMQGGQGIMVVNGDNVTLKNIYGRESKTFGLSARGQNINLNNIILEDTGRQGIDFREPGMTSNNVSIVSDGSILNSAGYYGIGYFYLYQGVTNSVSTNIRVSRTSGNTHSGGHGIVFKSSDTAGNCFNNLVDGFIIENTYLEFNFPQIYDNTAQNGYIVKDDYLGENVSGIRFCNNAHANTASNIHLEGCAVSFWDWDDGLGGEGPNNVAGSAGYDNILNQITVDRSGSPTNAKGYSVAFHYFGNSFYDGSALDNTFYNCTFYDTDHMFQDSRANTNTQFINCVFDNIPDFQHTASGPGYAINESYSSVNFSNLGFADPTGTNITTVDPGFVDAANGDFEVTHASLLGQGIVTPFLAVGNDIGAVQSGGGPTEINVTSVTTYPNADKMLVAGTRQLYEFVIPSNSTDPTGVWSTDNGSVATVNSSSGLVTAQGVGSCTITWTANDTTNGTITDTTAITVESSSTEDSIAILDPQGYWTPTSVDADSWDDTSGFELHGTEVGTIDPTGNQATFDGSSYYDLPDNQFLDYQCTVNEFTVIYREGDTSPLGQGYVLSKMNPSPGSQQYGAMAYNNGIERYYAGGQNATAVGVDLNDNRLVIVIFETTQVNVWVDGVNEIINSTAIGSDVSTYSANIGGRNDGSYLLNNGATLDIVATIPKAISEAERLAIETEFKINGATPVVDFSTKPTGINGLPVYYSGTTRKYLNPN